MTIGGMKRAMAPSSRSSSGGFQDLLAEWIGFQQAACECAQPIHALAQSHILADHDDDWPTTLRGRRTQSPERNDANLLIGKARIAHERRGFVSIASGSYQLRRDLACEAVSHIDDDRFRSMRQ